MHGRNGVGFGVVASFILLTVAGCTGQQESAPPATTATTAPATTPASTPAATPPIDIPPALVPPADDGPIPDTRSPLAELPDTVRPLADKVFTGDFDEMVKRRMIRVGVTFNRTHYFIDKGQERGITYEALKAFETDLNKDLKTGNLKVHVVIVPLSRDQLYPALSSGKIDMVAAMVTVRPEVEKLVAFSEPTRTNVSEVVVTGPGAPAIATVDDLAGQEVFVRNPSVYAETIAGLNQQLKARGKPAIVIAEAPQVFEDDDVLEMVNAGLAPITIVDDYLAEFWTQVFTSLEVHRDVSVRSGGELAAAFRRENPRLRETANQWIRKHGKGDAFRNVLERRYLKDAKYAKNAAANSERQKLLTVAELFKKYGTHVRPRLPSDGGAGLPGVDAGSECQEPGGCHRCDADHAADRQGAERRRHPADRAEHPRRREVHAVHDRYVLQGRAHGQAEQGAHGVCRL